VPLNSDAAADFTCSGEGCEEAEVGSAAFGLRSIDGRCSEEVGRLRSVVWCRKWLDPR
jgi:hypothetical protein